MVLSSVFWDTCVLYRWLNGSPEDYLDHIGKYLEEASSGQVSIFISTISLAEIRPNAINRPGLFPSQVISEISKSLNLIDTSPAIMSLAGYLRDKSYRLIEGPDKTAPSRLLGIGDAIQLATAVALREEFGVQNLTLHTFDEGKRRDSLEEKRAFQ